MKNIYNNPQINNPFLNKQIPPMYMHQIQYQIQSNHQILRKEQQQCCQFIKQYYQMQSYLNIGFCSGLNSNGFLAIDTSTKNQLQQIAQQMTLLNSQQIKRDKIDYEEQYSDKIVENKKFGILQKKQQKWQYRNNLSKKLQQREIRCVKQRAEKLLAYYQDILLRLQTETMHNLNNLKQRRILLKGDKCQQFQQYNVWESWLVTNTIQSTVRMGKKRQGMIVKTEKCMNEQEQGKQNNPHLINMNVNNSNNNKKDYRVGVKNTKQIQKLERDNKQIQKSNNMEINKRNKMMGLSPIKTLNIHQILHKNQTNYYQVKQLKKLQNKQNNQDQCRFQQQFKKKVQIQLDQIKKTLREVKDKQNYNQQSLGDLRIQQLQNQLKFLNTNHIYNNTAPLQNLQHLNSNAITPPRQSKKNAHTPKTIQLDLYNQDLKKKDSRYIPQADRSFTNHSNKNYSSNKNKQSLSQKKQQPPIVIARVQLNCNKTKIKNDMKSEINNKKSQKQIFNKINNNLNIKHNKNNTSSQNLVSNNHVNNYNSANNYSKTRQKDNITKDYSKSVIGKGYGVQNGNITNRTDARTKTQKSIQNKSGINNIHRQKSIKKMANDIKNNICYTPTANIRVDLWNNNKLGKDYHRCQQRTQQQELKTQKIKNTTNGGLSERQSINNKYFVRNIENRLHDKTQQQLDQEIKKCQNNNKIMKNIQSLCVQQNKGVKKKKMLLTQRIAQLSNKSRY